MFISNYYFGNKNIALNFLATRIKFINIGKAIERNDEIVGKRGFLLVLLSALDISFGLVLSMVI